MLVAYLGIASEVLRPTVASRLQRLGIQRHEESFPSASSFSTEIAHVLRCLSHIDTVLLVAADALRGWHSELALSQVDGTISPRYELVAPDLVGIPAGFRGGAWAPEVEGLDLISSVVEFAVFLLAVLPSKMLRSPDAHCFSRVRHANLRWRATMIQQQTDSADGAAIMMVQGLIYRQLFEKSLRQAQERIQDFIMRLPVEVPAFATSAHLIRVGLRRQAVPRIFQLAAETCHDWQTFREYLQGLSSDLRSKQRPLLAAEIAAFLCEFPERQPELIMQTFKLPDVLGSDSDQPILYLASPHSTFPEIRSAAANLRTLALPLIEELRNKRRNALYRRLYALRNELYPAGHAFLVLPEYLSADDNEEVWTQKDLSAVVGMRPVEV